MNNTTFTWTKVSKGGGPYSSVSSTDQWRFVAVQQSGDRGAGQRRAAGVRHRYIDGVRRSRAARRRRRAISISSAASWCCPGFCPIPQRVQWSGLNDVNGADSWTPGVNSSDFQDLPDGGIVRGVAGGETGVILQDQRDPAHDVCAGLAGDLPDRADFAGQGAVRPLLPDPRRRADLLLLVAGLSSHRSRRLSGADRARAGGPHILRRSRQRQPAAFHRRRRPAQFAGVLGLQVRQRHRQPVRQDPVSTIGCWTASRR